MASAPGMSSRNVAISKLCTVRPGNPDGMSPATCTPLASPPSSPIRIVAPDMTMRAAGTPGARKRNASIPARHSIPVRRGGDLREMLQDVPKLRQKVARGPADPEQMRNLTDDGDVHEAFDKTTHNRCGDEAGYPSH